MQLSAQDHNFYFYSKCAKSTQSSLPHAPICLNVEWLLVEPLHVWFWRCRRKSNHSGHQLLTVVPVVQWASPPWACPHNVQKGQGRILRATEGATILNADTPSNVGAKLSPRQMAAGHQKCLKIWDLKTLSILPLGYLFYLQFLLVS